MNTTTYDLTSADKKIKKKWLVSAIIYHLFHRILTLMLCLGMNEATLAIESFWYLIAEATWLVILIFCAYIRYGTKFIRWTLVISFAGCSFVLFNSFKNEFEYSLIFQLPLLIWYAFRSKKLYELNEKIQKIRIG